MDIETIYADLDEYLGGDRVRNNPPREPVDVPMAEHVEENEGEEEENEGGGDPPDDDNGDDIVDMALNGIPLNGQVLPPHAAATDDGADADMAEDGGESTN